MQALKKNIQKLTQDIIGILQGFRSSLSEKVKTFVLSFFRFIKKLIIFFAQLFLKSFKAIGEIFSRVMSGPVFRGITLSLVITYLYKLILDLKLMSTLGLENDASTMQGFIEWLGIPYSFIISMIFVRAWERADSIGNSIIREAYAISVFLDKIHSMPLESSTELLIIRTKIVINIRDYVKHVDENYSIEHKNPERKLRGDEKLNEIKQEIKSNFETDIEFFDFQLIQSIHDVMDARNNRLLNSNLHVQTSVWMLLLVSSILWLAPFMFIIFHNLWLGYLLFGSITFIVVMTITTIYFFNRPTNIQWNDTSKSWEALKVRVASAT